MAIDLNKWASPDYLKWLPIYTKIRDCYNGEEAIKTAADKYLPMLKGQTPEDYKNYLMRALFFPITGKTTTSMIGLATAKPPKVQAPDLMADFFKDDDADYQWTEFYVKTFTEVVLMGRYGVLIDAPEPGVASDDAPGAEEPDLCTYIAENIMKWEVQDDKLVRVILREFREVPGGDRFEVSTECVYRHCFIDVDGVYKVEELDDELKTTKPPIAPTFMGKTIDFVPFVFFGATGSHFEADKPPMHDITTINLSHYLTSADLEWGRHIVGLPTPVVTGVDLNTNLHIGGTAAWILPTPEAKAFYLEFQGQGLQSLEKALQDKVSLMASISARLIDNSTRGSEAAETVRLRYMSESASLIHIIGSVETGMNMLFNMVSKLMLLTESVSVKFSREIIGVGITFKDLDTLLKMYLAGSISKESFIYNLRRLDALDPNRTDDQELKEMRDPPPPVQKPFAGNPQGNNAPAQ